MNVPSSLVFRDRGAARGADYIGLFRSMISVSRLAQKSRDQTGKARFKRLSSNSSNLKKAAVTAITKPWDVVIVDEAHAARQRIFGGEPNQFLSLLQEFKRRKLFRVAADGNADADRAARGA